MNMTLPIWLWVLMVTSECFAGEFQNLSFDEADTSELGSGRVSGFGSSERLLPGWQLTRGTETNFSVLVNDAVSFDLDLVVLFDRFSLRANCFVSRLDPGFVLYLSVASPDPFQFRGPPPLPVPLPWHIAQTGRVPAGTLYMSFVNCGDVFETWIDGIRLEPIKREGIVGDTNWVNMAWATNMVYDVRKYAGRDVRLEFVGPIDPLIGIVHGSGFIDNIRFHDGNPRIRNLKTTRYENFGVNESQIVFNPLPLKTTTVEYRDGLGSTDDTPWKSIPNDPSDWGHIFDYYSGPQRFYRLKAVDP